MTVPRALFTLLFLVIRKNEDEAVPPLADIGGAAAPLAKANGGKMC